MTSNPVRTRFAPSPTGHLHVGGARTAIFNWLFARRHQGTFIVRVEDTDQARSTRESEAMVLDDLRWLGLDWDEGPDIEGPHAPYRQSDRLDLYGRVAESLVDRGLAYRCFCTEEELDTRRKEAEHEGRPPHYDLSCYRLSSSDTKARILQGDSAAIRFHVPKQPGASFDSDVTIDDLVRGEVTWKKESLGDFIVLRSDGMPTYNFSVVVDDHDMEITHVIRAEEHLTNTQRQVLLYRALGWDVPLFAHVSLILEEDRSKLSKRHGATSVSAFADEGYLADAMVNYLTLLGWSPPDGQEIFDRATAIQNFSFDRVNSAGAVFDAKKFSWLNGEYIRKTENARLRELLGDRFRAVGWLEEESAESSVWLEEAIDLVKTGTDRLADFVPQLEFLFDFDAGRILADAESKTALEETGARNVLDCLQKEFVEHGEPETADAYRAMADRVKAASGEKGKKLFMPLRVALTGSLHGPELQRGVPLMTNGRRASGLRRMLSPAERVDAVLAVLDA